MAKSWQSSRRGVAKCLHIFMAKGAQSCNINVPSAGKIEWAQCSEINGISREKRRPQTHAHVHAHTTV